MAAPTGAAMRVEAGFRPGDVAIAVRSALDGAPDMRVLTFDDARGRVVDLDLRGSDDDIRSWARGWLAENKAYPDAADAGDALAIPAPTNTDPTDTDRTDPDQADTRRSRGRPRLGIVAREVTLLPRHWDWLAEQPGGASVALRKLVEAATRALFAGDAPGFERASALAGRRARIRDPACGAARLIAG